MLKYALIAFVVGCGTNESDLTGSYRVTDDCENGQLVIASDQSIMFNDRPATNVMIDGVRTTKTDTPNVTFIIDYILGGEGGHIHFQDQLWMDHDGGSGTMSNCTNAVVTRM